MNLTKEEMKHIITNIPDVAFDNAYDIEFSPTGARVQGEFKSEVLKEFGIKTAPKDANGFLHFKVGEITYILT